MPMGLAIGEIARRAGLRPSAIRYYERVGLLPRPDRVSGRRRYDPEMLNLLAAIDVSKRAGFSLAEVATLFALAPGGSPAGRWQRLSGTAAKMTPTTPKGTVPARKP